MNLTLGKLSIYIAIAAIILTMVIVLGTKKSKAWWMSYLQNFTGLLFIFSGFVKAIDPLGTAYKMEQYFAEFETTFQATSGSFLAPLFPWLSEYSIGFSVFMIVLEIILGIMLVVGSRPKLTAWLFLLMILFFAFLTGFTYLTAYVPSGVNFFDFAQWGPYKETNMRVTDCGCFGDFLKLVPRVSFFKDLVLLVPAILFVVKSKLMHQLFTPVNRSWMLGISTLCLLYYCMSNYVWELPQFDFRPFKIGADVAAKYKEEKDAAGAVKVLAFVLKNKETGEVKEVAYNDYMKNYAAYPAEVWETIDQIKTEPTIAHTKISDFHIETHEGSDVTDVYLENPKYHFMLVSHKSYLNIESSKKMVPDSIFVSDTVITLKDTSVVMRLDTILQKEITSNSYIFEKAYFEDFAGPLKTFMQEAIADGNEVSILTGGLGVEASKALESQLGVEGVRYFTADNILLKTIVRSNPGIVLWKDGKIVYKWHKKQLPAFSEVKSKYIK